MALAESKCVPCEGGVDPLESGKIKQYSGQVPEWDVVDNHHLARDFKFRSFAEAFAFVSEVARIAEEEQHHPELSFGWGHAEVRIWTHAIDGLHENDFVIAAKIDALDSTGSQKG